MEIFYSKDVDGGLCRLDAEESGHCVRVLRHRVGDEIAVIDGEGSLMRCRLVDDSPKGAVAEVVSTEQDWGGHPYRLHLAVCPTKNLDRYEWFAEKACEVGVDEISPIVGEHSERRVLKTARLEKILISAAKQSLKGRIPAIHELQSVSDFIRQYGAPAGEAEASVLAVGEVSEKASSEASSEASGKAGEAEASVLVSGEASGKAGEAEASVLVGGEAGGTLRLIAYCFENEEVPRVSIKEALERSEARDIIIMIGPEGDFSPEEARLALSQGFIPVHLGTSRLRTETAAVTAAQAAYFRFM